MTDKIRRRTVLASVFMSTSTLVAGCLGTGESGSQAAMKAKDDIDKQPVLGPSPANAQDLVIAFEDPSCPACRRFEEQTFPELESKLVQTGKVAFVYREYPHVRDWAGQATEGLEATYAHDEKAFWRLKAYYYDNQDDISTDNVFEKTREYLDENTSLDADAVVSEAKANKYNEAVRIDEQARKDAGVTGTPTFFLFTDGSFDTKFVGNQDYSVFKNALGV